MLTVERGSMSTTSAPSADSGLVRHAPGDDVELAWAELDVTLVHPDGQLAAQDEEHLVGVWVTVPGEGALGLDHADVVVMSTATVRGDHGSWNEDTTLARSTGAFTSALSRGIGIAVEVPDSLVVPDARPAHGSRSGTAKRASLTAGQEVVVGPLAHVEPSGDGSSP